MQNLKPGDVSDNLMEIFIAIATLETLLKDYADDLDVTELSQNNIIDYLTKETRITSQTIFIEENITNLSNYFVFIERLKPRLELLKDYYFDTYKQQNNVEDTNTPLDDDYLKQFEQEIEEIKEIYNEKPVDTDAQMDPDHLITQ